MNRLMIIFDSDGIPTFFELGHSHETRHNFDDKDVGYQLKAGQQKEKAEGNWELVRDI